LSFDSGLQLVADNAAFRGWATPGVDSNIRGLARVAFVWRAANRVRSQEKLHALDVPGWCARAIVFHVTATNPLRAWRHSNLVSAAVIAYRCARCVRAMAKTVARLGGIDATNANVIAVVDGIVPVKIVIAGDPIPSAVMRLQGVMRPANAGIRAGNDDSFPSEPERPDIGRVRVSDTRLDRRWSAGYARLQWRFFYGAGLREIIVNVRVACHARDVRASSQCFGELPVAFH